MICLPESTNKPETNTLKVYPSEADFPQPIRRETAIICSFLSKSGVGTLLSRPAFIVPACRLHVPLLPEPLPRLCYFRARYYDPASGIFIARDPLEYVDGLSMYRGYFVNSGLDPTGKAEITEYRPQKDIVGFPWQRDDALRYPTLGTTTAELFVDCWCKKEGPGIGLRLLTNCSNMISVIMIGGSGSVRPLPVSYKLIHHKIRFSAKIKLSPRNILRTRNRHSLQSVYGHEQRHLKSLRTKAEEIAGKLSSRSFPTREKCIAACNDDYTASKDEFKEYVDKEIDHNNPLSPSADPESARDYDPYSGEFPPNPKNY